MQAVVIALGAAQQAAPVAVRLAVSSITAVMVVGGPFAWVWGVFIRVSV